MALEVEIDREVCMGSGNCVYEAPGVFDLDDDGVAFVVDPAGRPRTRSSPRRGSAQPMRSQSDGRRERDADGRHGTGGARRVAWRAATYPKTMVLAMLAPGPR